MSDCHRRIERFLDVLVRIARDYGHDALPPQAMDAVNKARQYFAVAAPRHTADEEESLFPRMKAAALAGGRACEAIDRLEGDHEQAKALHARVDPLLDEWVRAGSLPTETAAELCSHLESLRELYRSHIHTEDAEIFPLAATLLSARELEVVGSEMRARRGLSQPK